jgi:hypothetical protein
LSRHERRRHVRYSVVESAYAALGSAYFKVGKVKDCSKKGLAFEYLENGERRSDGDTVDIFLMEGTFHIHNLACEIVYDVPLYGRDGDLYRPRRCGVNFNQPTFAQQKQITSFLEQYAIP